ncbi:hypothetical protein [Halovenus marina]|uniref:hypothetical protein n=1 Tax=Halovenus marina TaxID=3396621 RepID=UPI003F577F4A
MADAIETYLRTQWHNWKERDDPSKYERHRFETYPRIHKADRLLQERYAGNLTTAMLTRRLSPTDERDNWMTPWECNEMLHGGQIHRSVNRALRYHLGEFEFVWVAVTAPTRSTGTPHEHIYLWVDDPENEFTVDHLKPALEKHLNYCDNAYRKHHRHRPDGTDGAITVYHSPPLIGDKPEKLMDILEDETPNRPSTTGAQYLASQLAHLPVRDYYETERENPPKTLFEGAALAWASPYNWLRTGEGFPV